MQQISSDHLTRNCFASDLNLNKWANSRIQPVKAVNNQRVIDFRSDVLSKCPPQMLLAMSKAQVGDDVFGDDLTTIKLEQEIANKFNKQSALFFPTATMANLATMMILAKPNQQIIAQGHSHMIDRSSSNLALFAGVLTRTLFSQSNGLLNAKQVQQNIRKQEMENCFPNTTVLVIQNPASSFGKVYPLELWKQLKSVCQSNQMSLHVDGARIFNAIHYYQCKPQDLSALYDTMTICLSKGLSCPTGALVLGKRQFIEKLRYLRKALGGGMRQTGILAAAGLWALENMPQSIRKDNEIACLLGKKLSQISQINVSLQNIESNMVCFNFGENKFDHQQYKKYLKQKKIKIKEFNEDLRSYRLAVYPQIREDQVTAFIEANKQFINIKNSYKA